MNGPLARRPRRVRTPSVTGRTGALSGTFAGRRVGRLVQEGRMDAQDTGAGGFITRDAPAGGRARVEPRKSPGGSGRNTSRSDSGAGARTMAAAGRGRTSAPAGTGRRPIVAMLLDLNDDQAAALLRTWGETVQVAAELWRSDFGRSNSCQQWWEVFAQVTAWFTRGVGGSNPPHAPSFVVVARDRVPTELKLARKRLPQPEPAVACCDRRSRWGGACRKTVGTRRV